mmetsp:Transcript_11325/g.22896  ORF Transcript_11325/g.22896 Transcript_11325/m.22896 type:complete len:324 (+) Transcript_11325:367-1338(+)
MRSLPKESRVGWGRALETTFFPTIMAAPVVLPLRSISLVFGAGFLGSWVYTHGESIRSVALDVLMASAKRNSNMTHTSQDSKVSVESLVSQVERLASEIRGAAGRTQVVTLPVDAWWTRVVSWRGAVLVGCSLGCAYIVATSSGWSLTDLAWVTKKTFLKTYQNLHQTVLRLAVALNTAKEELSHRIHALEEQLDTAKKEIEAKVENEVGKARKEICKVDGNVVELQDLVRGLEGQLGDLHGKMVYANRGIQLLCHIVSGMPPETSPGSSWDDLKTFAQVEPTTLRLTSQQRRSSSRQQGGLEAILSADFDDVLRQVRAAERA